MGFSLSSGHDWFNLLEVLLFVIGSAVASITAAHITSRAAHKRSESSMSEVLGQLGAVKEQVQNGHTNNLRDDMDDIRAGMSEIRDGVTDVRRNINGIRSEMGGIRSELSVERDARVNLEQRVDDIAQHTPRPRRH